MLEIQVFDTGIGIKQEDQIKLFNLFAFLDAT
jgi:signal transduction histidine kinase